MMYWWTDKITQAPLRQRGGGMQALRMDKNGGVCSRTNPWPERCFGTEFILDTWNREGVRFAFGTRPPTSGRKRALISCKSVSRAREEAIFSETDSGYIQQEKVLHPRSCDLLHMDTQSRRVSGGGDCCGVLPAAFHLLPFPNTFILRSVTRAKTLWI